MKKGYSILEVLIVLLLLSVAFAASAPILTKKSIKNITTGSKQWEWLSNTSSTKFNFSSNDDAVLIGTSSIPTGSGSSKIYIDSNSSRNHIEFSQNGESKGGIKLNKEGIFIGTYDNGARTNSQRIAIGYDTNATGANSTAIGTNASVSGRDSIAIGHNAHVSGNDSILFGSGCVLTPDRCLALIPPISDSGEGAKANTSITVPNSVNVVPIGGGNVSPQQLPANNAVLIGIGAQTVITDTAYIPGMLYAGNISAENISDNSIYVRQPVNQTNISANNITSKNVTVQELIIRRGFLGNYQFFIDNTAQQETERSDIRLKNLKGENKNGLNKIKQLQVYNYTFKNEPDKKRVGIVAQELIKIFPDAVSKDKNGYYVIRREDIFYALVNAVKELDQKLETILNKTTARAQANIKISRQITVLKEKSKIQEYRIKRLEKRINKLTKTIGFKNKAIHA